MTDNNNKTESPALKSLQLYEDYLGSLSNHELENMIFQTITDARIHLNSLYNKFLAFTKENQQDTPTLHLIYVELLKRLYTLDLPYTLTITEYFINSQDNTNE